MSVRVILKDNFQIKVKWTVVSANSHEVDFPMCYLIVRFERYLWETHVLVVLCLPPGSLGF